MASITAQCPTCMAPTDVSPESSRHQCGYCHHEFYVAATESGKALIHRLTSERLEPQQRELDELRAMAVYVLEEENRPEVAEAMMKEWVGRYGAVYRETNYYGLMGLFGEEAISAYERDWLAREIAGLKPSDDAQAVATDSQNAYAAALVDQAFPALVAALDQMMREQIAVSPDWLGRSREEIDEAVRTSIQDHCWQLPWVSDEELRSLGMQFSTPQKDPSSGQWQTACAYCGAGLALREPVESTVCEYCGATSRMRLSEFERLRAHGASDAEAQFQLTMQSAVAKEDISAALATIRHTTDAMAPAGSARSRELQYYYGRTMFPWLVDRDDELVEHLGLSPSKSCRYCQQTVALAPDGDGVCPICQQS